MKIRPRILKFQNGGLLEWINNNTDYFNWFSGLYPDALTLGGNPLKQRNDKWDRNQLSSSHYTTDDLQRSAYNNYLYTNDYNARLEDLNTWASSQNLSSLTNEQIRDLYNSQAQEIRSAREAPQTYNAPGYSKTNRIFRNMFYNRSKQGTNTPLYNIGYQENIDDIEGTSTWQRRMDRYQTSFNEDTLEGLKNRTFYITKPDGTKVKVYKKENGDIELFPDQSQNTPPSASLEVDPLKPNVPDKIELSDGLKDKLSSITPADYPDKTKFNWDGIIGGLQQLGPNLLEDLRLGLSLNANLRIYDASLKGIRPNLMLTYLTHRLVVGDEATKLAYYRRAAAGQTKAAQPFTSDADRQMAYQMEAKRIGDELRAQGDLADNAEIRRTSDESNQHQWANTQRRTEVANLNVAQINAANLAKLNLLALKYAADHSSWDNFLKGREYRWRQRNAENQAYLRQLLALLSQYDLLDDERMLVAELAVDKALEETKVGGTYNYNHPKVIEARKAYQKLLYEIAIENLKKQRSLLSPLFVKSGTKLTYKRKDDLLYKSARDVVEHFRKMTKLTDDSYLKSRKKTPKLTPHPTKKLQQGGVAPFTVFTPVALGGEYGYQASASASASSGKSSSSSKENEGKDTIELIKKLFEQVSQKGLPIDVDGIYLDMTNILGKAEAFGRELSTHEIATMYLRSMQQLNLVLYNAAAHKDAKTNATQKDALNEIAIDNYGLVVVQDVDTRKINYMSVDKAKKAMEEGKGIILTNDLLLDLRAISPQLKFDTRSLETVNSGIGMSKVTDWIKSNIASLGSTEETLEGYTKKESDNIKSGLRMLQDAPEGVYKTSDYTKTLKDLFDAAIRFLEKAMPDNMQRTLKVRAELNGVDPGQLIIDAVAQRVNYSVKHEVDAMTGKAAKDANGNSKESSDGLKLDAASAFITGKGYNTNMELNTGSSYAVNVKGRYSEFQKHSGENMGAGITMLEASTSTLKGVLDWNKATLGGSTLNPTAYNYIVLNNGEVAGMDLPTKPGDKNTPDFEMLKKLELLDDQLLIEGIEDIPKNWLKVNEICSKLLLPPKYDSQGNLNKLSWNRFAAFLVTTTEKALNDKKVILDMLGIADEQTREFYENIIQSKLNDKKYSLDSGWPIFGGKEELYQGTVFVPVKNNLVAGAISSGLKISMTDATDLELRQRGYDLLKISTYKKNELVL